MYNTEYFRLFIEKCANEKTRFSIITAGGGASLAEICKKPGSSNAIDFFLYLNDTDNIKKESEITIGRKIKSVSYEFIQEMLWFLKKTPAFSSTNVIAATCSLVTNRKQRAENRAILLLNNVLTEITFHNQASFEDFKSQKISTLRASQDEIVSLYAIRPFMSEEIKNRISRYCDTMFPCVVKEIKITNLED